MDPKHVIGGTLRIALGWIFLWAFLDKLIGLGFTTTPDKAWLTGASPTVGFLSYGTHGPFASLFQALAGSAVVDWLFMIGLLCIGLALVLGVGKNLAVLSGTALLMLMYLAALPPEHNPLIDDHIIYSLMLIFFLYMPVEDWLGLGRWWKKQKIVKKYPLLK